MNRDESIRSLSRGLSGCKLTISSDGRRVTKISSGEKYNERLIKQIRKQLEFGGMSLPDIETPLIFRTGKNEEGLEYFTMEYVTGKDYLDFLNYSSPIEIQEFCDSIVFYIESIRLTESDSKHQNFSDHCNQKLRSIKKDVPDLDFFNFLESKIKILEDSKIPHSFCHGDLTLSNILFGKKKIFLLDFLDSYIESWIIDLVKLKQDLFYFWSLSRGNNDSNLRCFQTSLKIWVYIEKKYPQIVSSDEFKILEALNFLRIYPYAKEDNDRLLIEKILKKLPIYEEFNSPNGR